MSSNINKSKRWILIFTGTVTSVVAIMLVVAGLLFIIVEGEFFGLAVVIFGLISMWFAQREFKEYRQLKKESEEMKGRG